MNTKSVQVVMSTYNGEKYLKEQIDSILSQEGVDVRLYIRDDGSSDRTTDILASYQEHKNVKIEKGNNLGFAKSFLTALDECDEADYYAFSDQDDVWEKDKLSTAIEILEEESQSTPLLYCSALQRVDENLNPLHVQSYHGLRINLPSMLTRGRLAGCTFVFNNTLRNLVKNAYNGLRQYIAVSICFYAMKYILNKDAKRYFLAVLIAFLFHKSALFFVPVYFLQYLKFDFKKAITIVGLTVLSGSGLFAILKFIIKYTPYAFYFTLNSVELNEIVASQSSILFFGVSTIIGYYYYSKEKEIDTKTQLLYNMQIISLSIALMTAFVPLINRVLYYGMAYELLYLPNMLKLINNRREKMLVKVFLILMYGGITAYGMINSGWYTCIPYNFYFDYR